MMMILLEGHPRFGWKPIFNHLNPFNLQIQGCTRSVGDMLKGIMYALGFWSETIRGDRDQYVTLMPINIKPCKFY